MINFSLMLPSCHLIDFKIVKLRLINQIINRLWSNAYSNRVLNYILWPLHVSSTNHFFSSYLFSLIFLTRSITFHHYNSRRRKNDESEGYISVFSLGSSSCLSSTKGRVLPDKMPTSWIHSSRSCANTF